MREFFLCKNLNKKRSNVGRLVVWLLNIFFCGKDKQQLKINDIKQRLNFPINVNKFSVHCKWTWNPEEAHKCSIIYAFFHSQLELHLFELFNHKSRRKLMAAYV